MLFHLPAVEVDDGVEMAESLGQTGGHLERVEFPICLVHIDGQARQRDGRRYEKGLCGDGQAGGKAERACDHGSLQQNAGLRWWERGV